MKSTQTSTRTGTDPPVRIPLFGFAFDLFGFAPARSGFLLLAPVGSGVQIGPNLGSQVISPRTCLRSVPFLLTGNPHMPHRGQS